MSSSKFQLGIIFGGPSAERGISINSARSLLDHLQSEEVDITALFVDKGKKFYLLPPSQLYSNTPSDFDFKLKTIAQAIPEDQLKDKLSSLDLIFPVIHGAFGEDGELQGLLEGFGVPFVGHSSKSCHMMYHKMLARKELYKHGFNTLPALYIDRENKQLTSQLIEDFFHEAGVNRAVIKPAKGGSSIGVYVIEDAQGALDKIQKLFANFDEVLLEPFIEGKEFTIIVFADVRGNPVALIPTEIELSYDNNEFFDYRKKYLPTNQALYHTPPRFNYEIVEDIRNQAEHIYNIFTMRDFVRIDGWLVGDKIFFTDINPISGLEQNSFLFRQSALLGMTHRHTLTQVIKAACRRYGLNYPDEKMLDKEERKAVFVLFGGNNAERQVSLMSGTNVWLKLQESKQYVPKPFLYDVNREVWELPYSYTLNHTVEEILDNCLMAREQEDPWKSLITDIAGKLSIKIPELMSAQKFTLPDFVKKAKEEESFIFLAMHGGEGENGTLQKIFEENYIDYNGSCSSASQICMDKLLTGQVINQLGKKDLMSLPKIALEVGSIKCFEDFWSNSCLELNSRKILIKPRYDGCSAGIVLLKSANDFKKYCDLLLSQAPHIPAHTFVNQEAPVEMPSIFQTDFLLEPFIETDEILIDDHSIIILEKTGWIELTIGILEQAGKYHAMLPSITLAKKGILTLEEKFQGGTGVNLTPPPHQILNAKATEKIRRLAMKAAKALGIQNYARLDLFFNRITEKCILIEANSLPGLTPSTVFFHQGLAESPPYKPRDILEKMISSKLLSTNSKPTIQK